MAATKVHFKSQSDGIIYVNGELTRNSLTDERLLNRQLESAQSTLYFDLSNVSRVDTAGLAWLIHSLGKLQQQDKRLELKNIPEQLRNLMALGQVSTLFE
ncbi:lipid asymmetry maintenance protein MlaB [Pseudoalteromonas sp. MMG012]|uniref:STAS domain-containing protein n=1 Tax=Pseudoalteromonas sp. MMG012 TaxID=2822686 RepID=UPI001B39D5E9|nr:STAS domain-containing protein [Pseudoalteromonas sp. MMG012]MBQ4849565.1 STAS domain-containing protein [Pseudoalteromonas sp. MMG012]